MTSQTQPLPGKLSSRQRRNMNLFCGNALTLFISAWNLCMAKSLVFRTPSSRACPLRWAVHRFALAGSPSYTTFENDIQEPFGCSPQSALEGAKLLIRAVNSVQLPPHHEWASANPQLDSESGSNYMDRILQYASFSIFLDSASFY
jgi:hypothetical protein